MRSILLKTLPVFAAIIFILAPSLSAQEQKSAKLSKEDEKKYELAFEAALIHHEKAALLYNDKKVDEAMKQLESLVSISFPKGTENRDGRRLQLYSYGFLAELQIEKKQFDKAVETLNSGIKLAPDVATETYQLYMTLGHAYKNLKKTNDALKAFEKAQKINEALQKLEETEKKNKPQETK